MTKLNKDEMVALTVLDRICCVLNADYGDIFSDDTSGFDNWEVDPITHQPIPKPIKEYPPTDYRRLKSYDE